MISGAWLGASSLAPKLLPLLDRGLSREELVLPDPISREELTDPIVLPEPCRSVFSLALSTSKKDPETELRLDMPTPERKSFS